MLEDPTKIHPFEEELDGNTSAELGVPGTLVAEVAHSFCQILHQRKPASTFLASQDVRCCVQDQDHGKVTGLMESKRQVKTTIMWEVVVAQLVERSLSIPEVRGSNPVIGKNLFTY